MKVSAVHTYFGGFIHGVKRVPGVDFITDYETWDPGFTGASAFNAWEVRKDFEKHVPEAVDLVIANPPCSRFSLFTTSGRFSECQRQSIVGFEALQDALDLTEDTEAGMLWWETGPMLWKQGRPMVREASEWLKKHLGWRETISLVVRYDMRFSGVPQRRPRCHIIHVDAERFGRPRSILQPNWPIRDTVWEFVEKKTKHLERDLDSFDYNRGTFFKNEDVINYIENYARLFSTFFSAQPIIVSESARQSKSVVTRSMAWRDQRRWFQLHEMAALMDYPVDATYEAFKRLNCMEKPRPGVMLLSKSVSPCASETLLSGIVKPWFEGAHGAADSLQPTQLSENEFELDLVYGLPNLKE